jgi:glycosyltransferase DesVII
VNSAPLNAVLTSCTAALHDGGIAASAAAMAYGLPQLPVTGDGTVADQIERLVTEPELRERADRLLADVLEMPSPAAVVPDLVELAGSRPDRGVHQWPAPKS